MLTGSKLFTNLSAAVTAAQGSLPVISATGLAVLTGNYTYVLLDDGVAQEVVKVTAVSGLNLTVLRGQFDTTPRAFVAGVCVKPYNGYETICELIAQGGCTNVSGATCVPVVAGGSFFPEAIINESWQAASSYANATTITVAIKPAWVTSVTVSGLVTLTGIPPLGTTDFKVVIIASGCNNSSVTVDRVVRICRQVGLGV